MSQTTQETTMFKPVPESKSVAETILGGERLRA